MGIDNVVPLDWAVIEFPGNEFKGEIAPEIFRLADEGLIRLVDAVLISKDPAGNVSVLEINQLPESDADLFADWRPTMESLFTEEDVLNAAGSVDNNCSALMLLWQNIWTEKFRRAVANANGRVVVHERVPAEVLNAVLEEMAADQA